MLAARPFAGGTALCRRNALCWWYALCWWDGPLLVERNLLGKLLNSACDSKCPTCKLVPRIVSDLSLGTIGIVRISWRPATAPSSFPSPPIRHTLTITLHRRILAPPPDRNSEIAPVLTRVAASQVHLPSPNGDFVDAKATDWGFAGVPRGGPVDR